MDKRGGILIGIVFAVMIFLAGMTFANFFKSTITDARVTLDCTNLNISDGAKLTCLGVDGTLIYWILAVLSTAGGYVMARINL